MASSKTPSLALNPAGVKTVMKPRRWQQTVSGITVITLGFQGAVASAVNAPTPFVSTEHSIDESRAETAETPPTRIISTTTTQPDTRPRLRFANLRWSSLHSPQPVVASLPSERLAEHRRELRQRSNQVESQLLELQNLLSLPAYGTSFADHLLSENVVYQNKLQELGQLEANIHWAIQQNDRLQLEQLQHHLHSIDTELRSLAQQQLTQHIKQAQDTSSSGLWQEPMYHTSLEWLMEYTHERHLLRAQQQALAQTFVAIAYDPER